MKNIEMCIFFNIHMHWASSKYCNIFKIFWLYSVYITHHQMQGWRNRYNDFEICTWCEETPYHVSFFIRRRSITINGGSYSGHRGSIPFCNTNSGSWAMAEYAGTRNIRTRDQHRKPCQVDSVLHHFRPGY